MKTNMSNHFSVAPQAEIQRSKFNRSSNYKTTFNAGYLIPFFADEALPGDVFNLNMRGFARLATPLKPTMDNMFMETFFFAIPNRLVFENWPKLNGEQDAPDDSTDFLVPTFAPPGGTGFLEGGNADYMGIPTRVPGIIVNSLHHRALALTYNTWFRDQNLQDPVVFSKGDGPDIVDDYDILLRRGKRRDYFTSCLPFPQKGPAVTVPLGTTAPVEPTGPLVAPEFTIAAVNGVTLKSGVTPPQDVQWSTTIANNTVATWDDPGLQVNLAGATAITVNLLRTSFQIQKLYERDARGGTRYTEILQSHFGVSSSDARLQRPEYLGGGHTTVNINPVASTVPTDLGVTPQGNLAGYGTANLQNHGFTKSFEEHCVIIGLVSVRADLTYQQGLNRMWSRQTRWDYYWPALAHIGEQGVLNKEIFIQGTGDPVADDSVFGYQEAFAEYRYKPSYVTNKFRSNDPNSLDIWHLCQDFDNLPVLNNQFIVENPPVERIIAVPTEPHFLFDAYLDLKCARPMPTYSVPGLIDHF